MIKYQYAVDHHNNLIHIDNVISKTDEVYYCISCSNILIPKMGSIRKKHFSHKAQQNCSSETYLHKLGKRVFIEQYSHCLNKGIPFFVELPEKQMCNKYENTFGKVCEKGINTKQFDLTKYYKNIQEEIYDGHFKPDIQLIGEKDQKIYVEIAVTHKVTEEKINCDIKIIEIFINNEEDLSVIISHRISYNDENVKIFNFNEIVNTKSFCDNSKCSSSYNTFILYNNGRSVLADVSLSDLQRNIDKGIVQYYDFCRTDISSNELFKYELISTFEEGYNVKNCFLCRYHADNKNPYDDVPIFCKFLKKSYKSNQASECKSYRPDSECFPEIHL